MLFPPRVKNIVQHPMIESWKPRLSLHLTDFLSSRLFHTTLLNTSGSAPFSPFQSTKRVLQVFQTSFLNGRENVFSHCYNKSEVFMLKWRSVCFSVWGCVLRQNWEQWLGASVPPSDLTSVGPPAWHPGQVHQSPCQDSHSDRERLQTTEQSQN